MPHSMTDEDMSSLSAWLSGHDIITSRIHREFSDATAMAKLLKKFHPKLVDLHNYTSFCGPKLKLTNWQVLNRKVLSKIGLCQSQKCLEKLALGEWGAIESLLYAVMMYEENIWRRRNNIVSVNGQVLHVGDGVFVVPVADEALTPQKMVLYAKYEDAVLEGDLKLQALRESQQRVVHLENLLRLKTERLTEVYHDLSRTLKELEKKRHCDLDLRALQALHRKLRE